MHSVQIFIPCFVDQLYPQTGMNMVKLLKQYGCDVNYNPSQTCCGQPAYNAGYLKESKKVATKFLQDFDKDYYIVSPSGSCTGFVRSAFPEFFDNTHLHNDCVKTTSYIYEISEFLTDILKVDNVKANFPHKVTYHDACGALRECGIKKGPRQLLQQVQGLELVEMAECETCCGFGGTFAVKFEPISIGMAQTKVDSALATGAEYIVTTDVSCMMHMQGYIDKHQLPIQTIHLVDVLTAT